MAEFDRLTEPTEWIDLSFVERERTPREIIEIGIRHHLAGLSPSNTVTLLDDLGVERSRTAVHNWVHKADLQPTDGDHVDRVAVDQKTIRINDQQYWLYTAVDPATNRILHSRLFPTYTVSIAREFLTELIEKHDVANAVFLVDDANDLTGGLRREGLSFRVQIHGYRNSVGRVFREVERRTSSFSNCFSNVDPATAEAWFQAHAVWWNHASVNTADELNKILVGASADGISINYICKTADESPYTNTVRGHLTDQLRLADSTPRKSS